MLAKCEEAHAVVLKPESLEDFRIKFGFLGPVKAAENWAKPPMSSIPSW